MKCCGKERKWKGWERNNATWICEKCGSIEQLRYYPPKPRGYDYGVPAPEKE